MLSNYLSWRSLGSLWACGPEGPLCPHGPGGPGVLLLVVLGVFLLQVDLVLVDVFYHLRSHYLLDLHLVILLLLSKGLQIFSLQVVDLYWGLLLQVGNHLHLQVNFHHLLQGPILFLYGLWVFYGFLPSMEVVLHLCLLDNNDNVILHCFQGNLSFFVS